MIFGYWEHQRANTHGDIFDIELVLHSLWSIATAPRIISANQLKSIKIKSINQPLMFLLSVLC